MLADDNARWHSHPRQQDRLPPSINELLVLTPKSARFSPLVHTSDGPTPTPASSSSSMRSSIDWPPRSPRHLGQPDLLGRLAPLRALVVEALEFVLQDLQSLETVGNLDAELADAVIDEKIQEGGQRAVGIPEQPDVR